MYLIDSPCPAVPTARRSWRRDWRRVGKAEVDMEVGAEVVEAKEEDEEEEKKEKEKEDNKIGVAEKSFPYCHAWCRFVIAILGLAKGYPLWTCFLAFLNKGFIRKSAVW